MATTFSTGDGNQRMVVIIRGVDLSAGVYSGWNRVSGTVPVFTRNLPGNILSVPAIGEQWVVARVGSQWVLEDKTDFQDSKTSIPKAEGMTVVGGTGPTYLVGSDVELPPSVYLGDWELRLEPSTGALQVRQRGSTEWTAVTGGGSGGSGGSVASADITDATTTGRAVLTSASAAAARTTLGAAASANAKGFVNHGANASASRPTGYASVEWYGSVAPLNATPSDTWVNTA